jgi:mannose-6-phosphate isomerase-like protein (cupin superfamily)
MNISRKTETKEIIVGNTMTTFEYPIMDNTLHGAVVVFKGRYPEKGRVVNEECYEIGYAIKGSGKLILEGNEIEFSEGDQLLIKPGQRYYWEADATMFMPCTPAWSAEQHKEVE